jgi:hypothetical protein
MPVAYTDLFNEALDDLAATLTTVTGLQVVTDPRNLVPPCAFIDAPSFVVYGGGGNIVQLTYTVRLITLGPGNLDAQRNLMHLASLVLGKNVAVTNGRPTIAIIGGAEMPAYDLTIEMQAQTS